MLPCSSMQPCIEVPPPKPACKYVQPKIASPKQQTPHNWGISSHWSPSGGCLGCKQSSSTLQKAPTSLQQWPAHVDSVMSQLCNLISLPSIFCIKSPPASAKGISDLIGFIYFWTRLFSSERRLCASMFTSKFFHKATRETCVWNWKHSGNPPPNAMASCIQHSTWPKRLTNQKCGERGREGLHRFPKLDELGIRQDEKE